MIATRYLDEYAAGNLDRLDVAYTQFVSIGKQVPVVETLIQSTSERRIARHFRGNSDRGNRAAPKRRAVSPMQAKTRKPTCRS